MNPLPTQEITATPGTASGPVRAPKGMSAFVPVSLFLLLCFTTATVWVREAWPLQWFQIGIYSLVIVQLLIGERGNGKELADGIVPLLVYFIPVWGLVQLLLHTTTSTFETRGETLRWGALAGVFYLTQSITRSSDAQRKWLNAILCFAAGMAVLCLMQLNTSAGRVLWVFPTAFSDIYATFQNKNNYVQFVELFLPIALWGAVAEGRRSWLYGLAGGILYASAVSAASRAGFVLCTAELITIPSIGLVRFRHENGPHKMRSVLSAILIVPLLAGAFTLAVGWKSTLDRFNDSDPFAIRREYFLGAVEMMKHRPLTGYGLGTFVQVYQKYSTRDFYPFYANHVHNDWAEFAADGGLPFLALVSIPFLRAIPWAFRHPWGLGIVAIALNACVDYPFPRPAVSGWMFTILAVLYMTRKRERREKPALEVHSRVNTPAAQVAKRS